MNIVRSVSAMLMVTLLLNACGLKEQVAFNKIIWIEAKNFSGDQHNNPRLIMYEEVQRRIQRLSRQDVQNLLGTPDIEHSDLITYDLGTLYSGEIGTLFINFNSHLVVVSSRVQFQ